MRAVRLSIGFSPEAAHFLNHLLLDVAHEQGSEQDKYDGGNHYRQDDDDEDCLPIGRDAVGGHA
jgi:hypothetical protein